jgi:hypothetical protein
VELYTVVFAMPPPDNRLWLCPAFEWPLPDEAANDVRAETTAEVTLDAQSEVGLPSLTPASNAPAPTLEMQADKREAAMAFVVAAEDAGVAASLA